MEKVQSDLWLVVIAWYLDNSHNCEKGETTFMGLPPTFFAATPNFFSRFWAVYFQSI
jgi:hypothetical protein